MSWDIYGNPLRRGHCEVHPHVHEEYPCSICIEEKRQYNEPYDGFEQMQSEIAQQGDYIRHLESERAALAARADSLLDNCKAFVKKEFELLKEVERLEIELKKRDEQNAALAAQVEALFAQRKELLDLIYNCAIGQVSMSCVVDAESLAQSAYSITGIDAATNRKLTAATPQQHLAEIRVQAVSSCADKLGDAFILPHNLRKETQKAEFYKAGWRDAFLFIKQYAASIRREVLCEKL